MSDDEVQETRAWVQRWRETAAALAAIKAQELSALTEEQAGRIFAEMSYDTDSVWISPERAESSGLIEQQRLFMLSDEHSARHRRRRGAERSA